MALKQNERIRLIVFSGRIKIFVGRGDVHSFVIVQDSREPSLQLTLVDEDGNAIDLTSGTGTFTMVSRRDATRKISEQSMALGATPLDGEIDYDFASGETDTPGKYFGEIEITPQGENAQKIFEMVEIDIRRKLAA